MAWDGFNTVVSGLFTSKRSLYVTGHNIANINNKDFSRQVITQSATQAQRVYGVGMLGTGTQITDVKRVRDDYINNKFWDESGKHGDWEIRMNRLKDIENAFNEPTDSSMRKATDDLYKAIEQLNNNPSDYASKSLVRESAKTFTGQLNELAKKLYNLQSEADFQVRTKVTQVNDYGSQIAEVNKQIELMELDGSYANDLRDKRDGLLDDLSKIVNIDVTEYEGKVNVSVGGMTLVDHENSNKLLVKEMDNAQNPEEKLSKIYWESSGLELKLTDGEIKGLLDFRGDGSLDGEGSGENNEYRGIPYYVNRLNEFASTFAIQMNKVHATGVGGDGESGKLFMTAFGENTDKIKINGKAIKDLDLTNEESADYKAFEKYMRENVRADNIDISGDLKNDLNTLATATADDGPENNKNLKNLLDLRNDKKFFDTPTAQGTPDEFLKSIVSTLAVDAQQAERMESNEGTIMKNVKERRMSDSGVSKDEETANMVKFQHAYNANARMIRALDEVYNIVVNQLGTMGR
ncbi:MAG: flagellar hook-associated protein FlgK [Tissierellales bacterium]|jgi:flagellar hook-associated protein 1 FlgK|nr:flagellar hook-associated protein FlgK [Tissierellales bacterium]